MFLRLLAVSCFSLFSFTAPLAAQTAADDTVEIGNGTSLSLFGIAKATEFRTDTYIAKLYAPANAGSVNELLANDIAKRMHLRYVAENYSTRKIGRHFKERIALNNDRSEWQPLTAEIVRFSNIFREDFQRGDEIVIDYLPGQGTTVFLNGQDFAQFNNPKFMTILLNAWVGSVPLSKNFDAGIKGRGSESETSSLLAEFSTLTPILGRFQAPSQTVAQQTDTSSNPGSNQRPQQTAVTQSAPPQVPSANQQSTPAQSAPIQEESTVTNTNEPVAETSTAEVTTPPANTSPANQQPSGSQAASEEPAATTNVDDNRAITDASTTTNNGSQNTENLPTEETLVVDADLLRGAYNRELINKVNSERFYPPKALRAQEQGEVSVNVTIDSTGAVNDIELVERSNSRNLDRAVFRIVKNAAPFPVIPPELNEETFSFEVTILFEL